jgi:hypothetical protein
MDKNLSASLNEILQISLPEKISLQELKEKLAAYTNNLVQDDFDKLVSLLYRLDINEAKLKSLLKDNPGEDAGNLIADMIIERQLLKVKSRQQHSKRDDNIAEDEKW